jgi:3-hydroxyisobutyrate dehydrogenase-like beta-hydroxyacid dehydrogenase
MVEVICFGEAVALAEQGGVERAVAVDAVLKSVAASPVLGYRGPFILEGNMPAVPLADVTLQQKDMILALNLGRQLGSPVPLAAAANEMMNACRGLGIDHNDFVVAHQVYRRLGGHLSLAKCTGPTSRTYPPSKASSATTAGSTCRCSS